MSFFGQQVAAEDRSSKPMRFLGDVQEIHLRIFNSLVTRAKKEPDSFGEIWQPSSRIAYLLWAITPSRFSPVTLVFPDGEEASFVVSREDTRLSLQFILPFSSSVLEGTLTHGPIRLAPTSNSTMRVR